MKIEILGCDGGYARGHHTTSALVDDDLLLDAGTGAGKLTHNQMSKVKNVLLSHSHLDHVASVCFMVDHNLEGLRSATKIYCLPHTAEMIRTNLINGRLWPNIEEIQINSVNMLEVVEIEPYKQLEICGKRITPLTVDHVVPTVGYALHGPKAMFVYISDMIDAPEKTWRWLNAQDSIAHIVMECSFTSDMERIAEISKHLTPKLLKKRLKRLKFRGPRPQIYVSHLKPSFNKAIRQELAEEFPDGSVIPLEAGMKFEI